MKLNPVAAVAAFALVAVPVAQAGQADICYGPSLPSIPMPPPPDNTTVFNCPQAGSRTVPELASLGWQVVQMTPVTTPGGDPTFPNVTAQLIIQKP